MENPLKKYLQQHGISVLDFSLISGINRTTLYEIIEDRCLPRKGTVLQICMVDCRLKKEDFEEYRAWRLRNKCN